MRAAAASAVLASTCLAACGQEQMHLTNLLEEKVELEVRAPKVELTGGCDQDFRRRFCDFEFVSVGTIQVSPGVTRTLGLADAVDDMHCTNLLWLRLVRLGDIGPIEDPGTLFELPSTAEIERGAGRYHSIAYPQATIRADEEGLGDLRQGGPPPTCNELGRPPRT